MNVHRVELPSVEPGGATLRLAGPNAEGGFTIALHVGALVVTAGGLLAEDVQRIAEAAAEAAGGEDLGLVVWGGDRR